MQRSFIKFFKGKMADDDDYDVEMDADDYGDEEQVGDLDLEGGDDLERVQITEARVFLLFSTLTSVLIYQFY